MDYTDSDGLGAGLYTGWMTTAADGSGPVSATGLVTDLPVGVAGI